MDLSHVTDTFIAFLTAILMWKAPALGVPIDEKTAHELAVGVLWLLGKLQKSPVPSLGPSTPKPPENGASPHGGS